MLIFRPDSKRAQAREKSPQVPADSGVTNALRIIAWSGEVSSPERNT